MYKILTLNNISNAGLAVFPENKYNISSYQKDPDAILVRSKKINDMNFPPSLMAIARAGAGTNNIPVERCSESGIVVFNTPGANANAVKELVLCGLLLSSRKISEGIEWVKTLHGNPDAANIVENEKARFMGPELKGKKIGVIGLGAIGVLVANAAKALDMEVLGYDPFMSIDSAWNLSRSVSKATSLKSIIEECEYITLHMPLNEDTKYMFNKQILMSMKRNSRLINFSRAELVETEGLKEALTNGLISCYVTDFPTTEILSLPNTIVMPHIGASTPESENNCAEMAAKQLRNFLEFGNISNSVNFPNCELPYTGKKRITIINRNIPNMITAITSTLGKDGINIDNMLNKSKGGYAYTLIDVDGNIASKTLVHDLKGINGIVFVRII